MIYIHMTDRHISVQTDGIMSDDEPQFEYEVDFGATYSDENDGHNNVQALLDEKDKNLMLAAELGKALLEKNSELEKRLEQTTEEFGQQLESLQQEKYGLHLKLENLEGEYENTARELQYDINLLKDRLDQSKQEHGLADKEKQHRINELSVQNERLLEDLQQSKCREQQYGSELHALKEGRLSKENTKHTYKIEHLQGQIKSLTERGSELERHLAKITEEKETLLHVIDEAQDKIKVLERQKQDQEEEMHKKDNKIRELHERVSHLNVQLDHMAEKASNSSGHSMTLFSELCQMTGSHGDLPMATDSPNNPYPPSMFGDDDIECDDDDFIMTSSSPIRFEEEIRNTIQGEQVKMETEIIHAYKNLRHLCKAIKAQMGDRVSEIDDTDTEVSNDTGSLDGVVNELKETIHEALEKSNQSQSVHLQEIDALQARVGELSEALTTCRGNLDKLQEQLQHREAQLQEKTYKVNELSKQVASQQEDIRVLSGQRDKLQEQMAGDRGRPQMYSAMALLRHARRERDAAVEKRYSLEKELQQCRYEIIVLNHQLIEAIQQKNSVSSLLDQWQSDMADLLGVQMDKHFKGAMNLDLKSAGETTQGATSGSVEESSEL